MHFSICLFLGLWFIAQFVWTFPYQQTAGVWMADMLWFIGYASFSYFLYRLYYHFFRTEHEPLVLVLIAIIISTVLIGNYCQYTAITNCSTSRFLDIVSYSCLPNFGCCIDFSSCIDLLGSEKKNN